MQQYAIAIHGGAGTILKNTMTPEKSKLFNLIKRAIQTIII